MIKMCQSVCNGQDLWVSGRSCMRLGIQSHPYGVPDARAGCPCERNLTIQKITCKLIAFRDCLSQGCSPIKNKELRLTLDLKDNGIYSPVSFTPYPFHLHIHLSNPHFIHINIGKLCRLAKFRFELINWTLVFKKIRRSEL